jgi:hypothetical protein
LPRFRWGCGGSQKTFFKFFLLSSLKDSNPNPQPLPFRTARLGPRPARPSCAPTTERPPAPHACSTRLAVLRVCCWDCGGVTKHRSRGTAGNGAPRGAAGSSRASSSCEPPSDHSRKKRAFPPMSGGAASPGVSSRRACATESDRQRSKGRSSPFGGGGLDACV